MDLSPQENIVETFRNSQSSTFANTFYGELEVQDTDSIRRFTIRFRSGSNTSWQWENQIHGTADGRIILQAESIATSVTDLIDIPESSFEIEAVRSQCPGATVSLLRTKDRLPPSDSGDARTELFKLGRVKDQEQYFALIRKWSPWLGPVHGKDFFNLNEDALTLSFLNKFGKHIVLMAVNDISEMLTLFKSDGDGNIVVTARNDSSDFLQAKTIMSVANEFEIAMSAAVYAARDLAMSTAEVPEVDVSNNLLRSKSVDEDTIIVSKDVEAEWLQDWYDGLSYCTWNSLGQDLTEDKLMNALESLDKAGIKITSVIIDDNWQSLDKPGANQFKRGWKEFEADSRAFPKGLKHATTTIRSKYTNIQHIAVWHALGGYWGWISPEGKIAKEYKTKSVNLDDSLMPIELDRTALAVDPDDIHRMYDDFYSFLSSSGIDSVKTDVQFYLDVLASTSDRRRFTETYQNAWLIAINKHFAGKAISCMSQIPQIIFHSLLPKTRPTILFRNSDDFFPDVVESHPYHIFWNAHNALLVQHLNVLPDWDMFQTSHDYAGFHAAARCVSGGPIYITDTPGEHDTNLINQMSGRNPRGQTIILRPSRIGKTLDVYNEYNERHMLRVGSYNGASQTGNGIIAFFNIDEREKSCVVPLKDFPGTTADQSYLVRSFAHGTISEEMQIESHVNPTNVVSVTLGNRGYDILTAYPLYAVEQPHGSATIFVGNLGLLDKMAGAAAIVATSVSIRGTSDSTSTAEHHDRLRIYTALKAFGTLGLYISNLETKSLDDDFLVLIQGRVIPVETVKIDNKVLTVDVGKAWDKMELDAGWSNEVGVEVLLRL